jgi:predicted amidohydrolase YtcJ
MSTDADLVVRGGRVWTGDPARPWAEAVAASAGRLVAVGSDADVAELICSSTEVVDAAGRFVMPGVIDSHNHLRLGSGDTAVQLAGATTLGEIRARIAEWLVRNPDATWVYGEGFDYTAVGGRRPRAEDLAGATGGRPAFLLDYSVHSAWLNAEALHLLGITATSGAAAFGHPERDPVTGEPTGYLNDYATYGISRTGLAALAGVVPAFSPDSQYERVLANLDMATRLGITTVVEPQNSLDDIEMYERARREGRLGSRVVAALFHPVGTSAEELDAFDAARTRYTDDRFRVGPLKLYIDDIVEPHTAAMQEPYANRPDTRGHTYYEPSEFDRLIARLDARGFQCFVHATGDRGNQVVLDAFEHAQRVNGVRDSRHQVVHVECLDAREVPRFAELGVVACMQPRHCAPEIVGEWRANVGPQRWRYAWPMRSIIDSGAHVAFSSDWNVAEMDPLVGIYTALTRASLDGTESWVPQERVELEQALRSYTVEGAWANFCEDDRGSLQVGKLADLAVFSVDPFAVSPAELLQGRVDVTVVDGQVAHTAP